MAVTTAWDVPTAAFQDAIKGSIGGTKMVARNLGNEDGVYEMVGWRSRRRTSRRCCWWYVMVLVHGFGYGVHHGFVWLSKPT